MAGVKTGNVKKHQYKIMNSYAIRCDDCDAYTTAVWKRGFPDILICFNCRKVYENMAGELVEQENKQDALRSNSKKVQS